MKLFLLTQNVNNNYNTYDACVVCAQSKEEAVKIHPDGETLDWDRNGSWATKDLVECVEIGIANQAQGKGVILASYNPG